MKRRPTKAERRQALQKEMNDFLAEGGEVTEVPQGVSGRENPTQAVQPPVFNEPAQPRTDVTNVLNELDARKKKHKSDTKPKRRPRKKIIYDDFGEPVRWVWDD